jgi:hypothetical protein
MRLPHLFGAATRPFTFVGCLELREILGRRARDERELMEGLEQVPAGSIYYHTHSIFLRHPRIGGGHPNDFANWAGDFAHWIGRELGRENFLITRHLRDYLSLLAHLSR